MYHHSKLKKHHFFCLRFVFLLLLPKLVKVLIFHYKFFCENGKFKTLQIITDRETDITLYYFDEALNYRPDYYSLDEVDIVNIGHPKLPSNIKDMIKIAEHLSSPFPFVKVDLYNADGKILFSELTFIPYG